MYWSRHKSHITFQTRFNSIVVFADLDDNKNVLAADVIKKLYQLRKKLGEINVGVSGKANSTWEATCSRKQSACQEGHILEIWAVNQVFNATSEAAVNALTDQVRGSITFLSRIIFTCKSNHAQDIIDVINNPSTVSGISSRPYNIEGQLGNHVKDSSGKITSAKAMTLYFMGTNWKYEGAMEWEEGFIDLVIKFSKDEMEPMGVRALPMAARYVENV